jgi:hypothetical protein
MGVEGATHPLGHADRTGLAVAEPSCSAPASLPGEEGLEKGLEHGGEQGRVDRQAETHGPGRRQDPVAVPRLGKEVIDEIGGGVGGATGGTGGTEPGLAAEGEKSLEPAACANKASEPGGEDTTAQVDDGADSAALVMQVRPNPAGGKVTVGFRLGGSSRATLTIHDVEARFSMVAKVPGCASPRTRRTIWRTSRFSAAASTARTCL